MDTGLPVLRHAVYVTGMLQELDFCHEAAYREHVEYMKSQ